MPRRIGRHLTAESPNIKPKDKIDACPATDNFHLSANKATTPASRAGHIVCVSPTDNPTHSSRTPPRYGSAPPSPLRQRQDHSGEAAQFPRPHERNQKKDSGH